jgi:8-oxo-dGTP diphosphatase
MIQKILCTGFLSHRNKILTIQRSSHEVFLPGYYELPGGKVDFGEDPQKALAREFLEEVGLRVMVGEPYHTFSYVSENGNRHTVEILYMVQLAKNETVENIRLSEDHMDAKWISASEVDFHKMTPQLKECVMKGFTNL